MKIIRYLDPAGETHFGRQHDDGSITRLEGCIYSSQQDTGEAADVAKRLTPMTPKTILCIGLNYRKHAEAASRGPCVVHEDAQLRSAPR